MDAILLATDLDGTLVGDDGATQKLNVIVNELRETKGLKFAYVTGRSPELFDELQKEKEAFQLMYEGQTNHSRNKKVQQQWLDKIQVLLTETEAYSDYP